VDLKRNMRLNVLLQVAGLVLLLPAGRLLGLAVTWLRPGFDWHGEFSGDLLSLSLLILLGVTVFILLHELVHGVFFWLFSGHRPSFGLGPGYAYAAMPDWYFPKQPYLVVGLAPLAVLTVIGLVMLPFVPVGWLIPLLAGMLLNIGGAIGDLYICLRLAREAEDVWIKDKGDGFEVYRRRVG
jgi:hypothetical protein